MTRVRKFEIALSNSPIVFNPGQCVQGHVLVELTEDMTMKNLSILCKGKGQVHWRQGKSNYSDTETYMNVTLILFGNDPQHGGDVTLSGGNHAFPFQFVLPVTLPGSFEGVGELSFVRYSLKATMSRPWKFDKTYKFCFTVASVLDLNTLPNVGNPVQSNDQKTVCCCCCESDPITANLRLDKTGYVPGESIVFDAEVKDGTGRGTVSTVVKFVMLTKYKIRDMAEKEETKVISKSHHGPVGPGQTDVWRREKIRIPPLPPSFLPGCNLIEIHYIIELVVDVANSPFDLHVPLSVVIGTIPLHSTVEHHRQQRQEGTITTQPQSHGASGVSYDMPPPSYREYVLGRVDTTEEDEKYAAGNLTFAPSYTYYDWM